MPATTQPTPETETFDVEAFRADFPALAQDVYEDTQLAYLDNAATSQKPTAVIERPIGEGSGSRANGRTARSTPCPVSSS